MAESKRQNIGGITMPETQKYKSWKAVTESDFVSLFIKTWFAYISTLRTKKPPPSGRLSL